MIKSWSIFTKPWKDKTPNALGAVVSGLGFDAIELPLRSGYQVDPLRAEKELPAFCKILGRYGVRVSSVASSTDEVIFAACQASDIHMIRIMLFADQTVGFRKSIELKKQKLESLLPLCEKYNVKIGVQQHYGFGIFNTMELRWLLDDFDPNFIGAVWDSAHSALSAEIPAQALDIIWDRLILVNLKMAYYCRANGPEADQAEFKPYFTTGRNGASSWQDVAAELITRGYDGGICMPAEYTDEKNAERYISRDFAYAKSLFN